MKQRIKLVEQMKKEHTCLCDGQECVYDRILRELKKEFIEEQEGLAQDFA